MEDHNQMIIFSRSLRVEKVHLEVLLISPRLFQNLPLQLLLQEVLPPHLPRLEAVLRQSEEVDLLRMEALVEVSPQCLEISASCQMILHPGYRRLDTDWIVNLPA